MSKLYVMCGCPASGKSTFILNNIEPDNEYETRISRDEIRFSMVKEDEEYFSREKEVFREFVSLINLALDYGYTVYADATHLNKASRNKLLRNIHSEKLDSVKCIFMNTSLETALERNKNRIGTRGYVPEEQIKKMYSSIEIPKLEEGFDNIFFINEIGMVEKMI